MKQWLLLPLLLLAAEPALALRCGSRVIDEGDRDSEVRRRCGSPFYTEQFYSVDVRGADGPYEVQAENVYDAWYFNFGPRRLMVRLLFLNGELQGEESLGYGVNRIGDSCTLDSLPSGTYAGEVVARCGEPSYRNDRRETRIRRDGRGNERYVPIRREEWTYDFGDRSLGRVVHFANGRLEQVVPASE